jgi:hypothetical protein
LPSGEPVTLAPEHRLVKPTCPKKYSFPNHLLSQEDFKAHKKLRFSTMELLTDSELIGWIEAAITNLSNARFNGVYGSNPVVCQAFRSKRTMDIFADLQSKQHSRCHLSAHPDGLDHLGVRVFFHISKNDRSIRQSCYRESCRSGQAQFSKRAVYKLNFTIIKNLWKAS